MALIAGMMVSCDPITESDPGMSANLTESDLQARVALTQTTAGQNKFTFSTNPTLTVQVLDQDGAILATGTEGSIIGTPPLTSLTVRAMNQDGSITSFSNDVTISEYVDVPSIYEGLFGPEYNSVMVLIWKAQVRNGGKFKPQTSTNNVLRKDMPKMG